MSPDSRVNDLLHTLRGEQFRHAQNLRRSRIHVSATIARTLPTLPIDFAIHDYTPRSPKPDPSRSAYVNAGPGPPKSWTLTKSTQTPEDTLVWRQRALALVFPEPSRVPTLANLCLRILAALPPREFVRDIVPWLAPHLRRDLIRHAAVHAPLPGAKLWPLYEIDGHADAELVVVGPDTVLRDDYFIRASTRHSDAQQQPDNDNDWDTDKESGAEPLSTLVLASTRLSGSTLLSLPPTITHMALINLPSIISLHRLPGTCPLLVLLDLSYNLWLSAAEESDRVFERVEWSRWNGLRVLGLRECAVSSTVLVKLNRGRWDDVEVIQ